MLVLASLKLVGFCSRDLFQYATNGKACGEDRGGHQRFYFDRLKCLLYWSSPKPSKKVEFVIFKKLGLEN